MTPKEIRHGRILDIRKKLLLGYTEKQIISFCLHNLQVSLTTARNYFNEAAKPYREKYWRESR